MKTRTGEVVPIMNQYDMCQLVQKWFLVCWVYIYPNISEQVCSWKLLYSLNYLNPILYQICEWALQYSYRVYNYIYPVTPTPNYISTAVIETKTIYIIIYYTIVLIKCFYVVNTTEQCLHFGFLMYK